MANLKGNPLLARSQQQAALNTGVVTGAGTGVEFDVNAAKWALMQGRSQGFDSYALLSMIAMRLHISGELRLLFQGISVLEGSSKVFVFVLQHDKPAIIEDDSTLFPSDTLIAALRLLIG